MNPQKSIRRILREDYSPAGKEIIPSKIVVHKSNPMFRDRILEEGFKVRVGECYQIYVNREQRDPNKIKCKPVIFATNSTKKRDLFDSTYDDDIWEINTEMIPGVKWYVDRHYGSKSKHIVTYQDIPREAITLIYEGTGDSEDLIEESIRRVLREEDRYDDKVGKIFWFEYHCFESPISCDSEIWYRSHQKVKVIGVSEWSSDNFEDRTDGGQPRVYLVEWEDGFQYHVFEDELMQSPNEFYRPDPPKRKLQENISRIKQIMGLVTEGLHDTYWQNENGDKITLNDLLDTTQDIPVEEFSVEELKPHLLTWDRDEDEVKKIESADLQYPILIFVNDDGEFISIIDGHHRAHKAIRRGLDTIKGKLIPINSLPKDIRRVFKYI